MPGLGDFVEVCHKFVETFRGATDDRHIVSIEEYLNEFVEFVATAMFDVEFSIDGVLESYAFVDAFESLADNVVKEKVEECWGEDTTLTDTVVDVEYVGDLAVGLDGCTGIVVEFLDEALQLTGKTGLC